MAKDKRYIQLINSARWQKLRRDVLTAHPLCQRCEEEGRITSATEVHHIRPVEEAVTMIDRQQRAYDPSNLRALCNDCHVKTHTELGRSGKEATKKRNARHVEQVINKFFGGEGG
jgi:5-methylcytosine-specific restriction protein A